MFSEAVAASLSNDTSQLPIGKAFERSELASGYRQLVRNRLRAREVAAPQTFVSPYWLAYYYSAVGDSSVSIDWLEKASVQRHPALVFLGVEPVFAGLRQDKRFEEIVRHVGVPIGLHVVRAR